MKLHLLLALVLAGLLGLAGCATTAPEPSLLPPTATATGNPSPAATTATAVGSLYPAAPTATQPPAFPTLTPLTANSTAVPTASRTPTWLTLTPRPAPPTLPPGSRPFPTPAVAAAPAGAEVASRLWVPFFPAAGVYPLLQAVRLDAHARRVGGASPAVDLGLEAAFPGPRLWRLHPAPGGQTGLAELAFGEATYQILVDLSSGSWQYLLPGEVHTFFLDWGPGGTGALFLRTFQSPDEPIWLDLHSGKTTPLPLPDDGTGYPPTLNAMVFSPDGKLLADVLSYHAVYQKRARGFLEIGLRPGLDGARRVLCTIPQDVYLVGGSLAFSPGGRQLAWIQAEVPAVAVPPPGATATVPRKMAQLWLADLATGACRALADLGDVINYAHPPAWSPDGRWIAAIGTLYGPDGLAYEDGLLLVDPTTGRASSLPVGVAVASRDSRLPTAPPPAPGGDPGMVYRSWGLSHLAWSPDGRFLAFTYSNGLYGEIRAVELASRRTLALAGPTPPQAPFVWLEK